MNEALVIGGGLAGAALATRLAQAGRRVLVLEREPAPVDVVCGEFLSGEALGMLASLGLDRARLGALGAVPLYAVRLCAWGRTATARLPFDALSLSRRTLDEALRQRATSAGAEVRRGAVVRGLRREDEGFSARLDGGERVHGRVAFLATGKHDLPDRRRPPGRQNDLVAFKMFFRLAPAEQLALAGHVELLLFEGGYAGLQPVEGSRANLCLVLRRARLAALGGTWPAVLAAVRNDSPHLDARLAGAAPCWPRPLALSAIPYGHVGRAADSHDGLFRLGDQAAVIPSFSGDGMAIALHSANLAAALHLDGRGAREYQRTLAGDVRAQVHLATLMSQALVRRPTQRLVAALTARFPRLLARVAAGTRVPEAALSRLVRRAPHAPLAVSRVSP